MKQKQYDYYQPQKYDWILAIIWFIAGLLSGGIWSMAAWGAPFWFLLLLFFGGAICGWAPASLFLSSYLEYRRYK